MRITIGFMKGGTGKSTTTMLLAFAFWAVYGLRVLVLDCDRSSQSAGRWLTEALEASQRDERPGDPWPEAIAIRRVIEPDELTADDIDAWMAEHRADVLLIDCPGHSKAMLMAALMVAPLFVMPCAPTAADMDQLPVTARIAGQVHKLRQVIALVLLTQVDRDAAETRRALAHMKGAAAPLARTVIPQSLRISGAFGRVPRQRWQYDDLADELREAWKLVKVS